VFTVNIGFLAQILEVTVPRVCKVFKKKISDNMLSDNIMFSVDNVYVI
jgi:hypothetical protein